MKALDMVAEQLDQVTIHKDIVRHRNQGEQRKIFINGEPSKYWLYAFNKKEAFYLPFVFNNEVIEIRQVRFKPQYE